VEIDGVVKFKAMVQELKALKPQSVCHVRLADKEGWTIRLLRASGVPLGIDYMKPKGFAVSDMAGTSITEWNQKNPDCQAMVGDRIVEVNGKVETAGMLRELKTQSVLQVRVVSKETLAKTQKKGSRWMLWPPWIRRHCLRRWRRSSTWCQADASHIEPCSHDVGPWAGTWEASS